MRRTILTVLFAFFAIVSSFAQGFTLTELLNLNQKDWDEFDTYVTKKGYKYHHAVDEDFDEARAYAYDASSSTGKAPYFITKTYYKKMNKKAVAFQTSKTDIYLSFKAQLKAAGFVYTGTENAVNSTFFDYKKGDIIVSLSSRQAPNSSGGMSTGYEIAVVVPKEESMWPD